MPPEEEADGDSADSQPRCEIQKTLLGGECHNPGEVRYRGTLLCEPHAALLELEDRAEAVLGSVFLMDKWLEENGSSQGADEEFLGRIRHERERAVGALRLMRVQIRDTRKALSVES
jgi:hypothetical protein